MRKILLLCIFGATSSCSSIDYDGETRLVTEMAVVDSNGNPISGQVVRIAVSVNDVSNGISNGVTDSSGKLRLIFPAADSQLANYAIELPNDGSSNYQYKIVSGILKSDFTDYKFTLPVVLYRNDEITALHIVLNHTTANTQISDIHLQGDQPSEYTFWHPGSDVFLETDFGVLKNHNINLVYTVTDSGTTPSTINTQTITLPIGSDIVDYTLNY